MNVQLILDAYDSHVIVKKINSTLSFAPRSQLFLPPTFSRLQCSCLDSSVGLLSQRNRPCFDALR